MNPRRLSRAASRAALPAAAAVLCGLLASCSPSGGAASTAASAQRVTVVPPSASPAPSPSMKTAPTSRLCAVLDTAVARQVLTDPVLVPRVAPLKGTAPDACSYASGDRTSMLTLNPSSRSYAAEVSAAHSLAADPASAGMREVKSTRVTGLGEAAFVETTEVLQPPQTVTFVVWHSGSRVWVLTLARPLGPKNDADKLVPVARRLTAHLPG